MVMKDSNAEIFAAMTAEDHPAWDSLSHINLVAGIEEEFGIRLKNAEVARLANVGDLLALVAAKTA